MSSSRSGSSHGYGAWQQLQVREIQALHSRLPGQHPLDAFIRLLWLPLQLQLISVDGHHAAASVLPCETAQPSSQLLSPELAVGAAHETQPHV